MTASKECLHLQAGRVAFFIENVCNYPLTLCDLVKIQIQGIGKAAWAMSGARQEEYALLSAPVGLIDTLVHPASRGIAEYVKSHMGEVTEYDRAMRLPSWEDS